jgi:V8-like Glu-specific endopeptidase
MPKVATNYRMTMARADAQLVHAWMEEEGFTQPRGPDGESLPPRQGPVEESPMAVGPMEEATQLETDTSPAQSSFTNGPPPPEHTWSDGNDSRARMAVADGFSINHWPFRTIAHMDVGDGCTGTVIGEKVLLTAGHCV